MSDTREHRLGPDRRNRPRGGRRTSDEEGFAPLVLLVGKQPGVSSRSETILAKLRFAVTTSSTVEEALRVVADLRPDLVVAERGDAGRIRSEAPQHLPVVVVGDGTGETPEALIDQVRQALRANRPQ